MPFAISLFSSLLSFLGGTIFFHGAVGVGANIAVVAWIGFLIIYLPAIYLYFTRWTARRMGARGKALFILVVVIAAWVWAHMISWKNAAAGIAGIFFGPTVVVHLLQVLIFGLGGHPQPVEGHDAATVDGGAFAMQPFPPV